MKKINFDNRFRLTQAVLEGDKIMTRRIVPNQLLVDTMFCDEETRDMYLLEHSRFEVGEVVAIARSYKDIYENVFGKDPQWKMDFRDKVMDTHQKDWRDIIGWENKLFVRADLMVNHIQIISKRIERLNDISSFDCIKEGILQVGNRFAYYDMGPKCDEGEYGYVPILFDFPKEAFAGLIDKISGKGTWESNPLTYVYTFKVVVLED